MCVCLLSVCVCLCLVSLCVCVFLVCVSSSCLRICVSQCVCVCICVCVCVRASVFVQDVFVGLYLSASVYACLGLIVACDSLFLALSFCLISASNLTYHLYYLLSLLSPFCSSPHLFSVHQLNQDQYVHNCSFMYHF